ncbi:MAG: AraC family transcriptional regulator [Myxococcota bacterium]
MSTIDYQRIERAIGFLEEHASSRPALHEVASHVGVSAFQFQRLFKQWAGISPKQFLQSLLVEQAKTRLRDSTPLLATTFDVGLSSPSRLHDLFVTTEAVTPGEFARFGKVCVFVTGWASRPSVMCCWH